MPNRVYEYLEPDSHRGCCVSPQKIYLSRALKFGDLLGKLKANKYLLVLKLAKCILLPILSLFLLVVSLVFMLEVITRSTSD